MSGAELLIELPHPKVCVRIHSHGVTKEFVADVILNQVPKTWGLYSTLYTVIAV